MARRWVIKFEAMRTGPWGVTLCRHSSFQNQEMRSDLYCFVVKSVTTGESTAPNLPLPGQIPAMPETEHQQCLRASFYREEELAWVMDDRAWRPSEITFTGFRPVGCAHQNHVDFFCFVVVRRIVRVRAGHQEAASYAV